MSVPATRTLPYVLRDALKEASSVSVLVGTVVSTPDNAHVRVSIQGTNVTIPKLATYHNPTVGEPVYILTDPLLTVALGAVSASLPAPLPMTNADTLDGLDSTGFLRWHAPQSGYEANLTVFGPIATDAGANCLIPHGLGRTPVSAFVMSSSLGVFAQQVYAMDAANLSVHWSAVGSVRGHSLVIG